MSRSCITTGSSDVSIHHDKKKTMKMMTTMMKKKKNQKKKKKKKKNDPVSRPFYHNCSWFLVLFLVACLLLLCPSSWTMAVSSSLSLLSSSTSSSSSSPLTEEKDKRPSNLSIRNVLGGIVENVKKGCWGKKQKQTTTTTTTTTIVEIISTTAHPNENDDEEESISSSKTRTKTGIMIETRSEEVVLFGDGSENKDDDDDASTSVVCNVISENKEDSDDKSCIPKKKKKNVKKEDDDDEEQDTVVSAVINEDNMATLSSSPQSSDEDSTTTTTAAAFTCQDIDDGCKSWTDSGTSTESCIRNSAFMTHYCPVSCHTCDIVNFGYRMITQKGLEGGLATVPFCQDNDYNCKTFAENGECTKNPGYMNVMCEASCRRCAEESNAFGVQQRLNPENPKENKATIDWLTSTVKYMRTIQSDERYSKVIKDCLNLVPDCTFWASKYECEKNPDYMTKHCAPACMTCDVFLDG